VLREHRIMSALADTAVPVPKMLAACTDTDVIGAPFFVMDDVAGHVVRDIDTASTALSPSARRRAGESLVDTLVALHGVDIDAVGLGDLAKRENYIARQLKRWHGQITEQRTRDLPLLDDVHARLAARIPEQRGAAIVHGDYRIDNCILRDDGTVAAVLDWELCTLGDPLADLGYLGVYWSDGTSGTLRANDPTPAGGFPLYRDLVERYANTTGRDVSGIDYYVAFSCWRLAVISEGVYARYLHGAMGDQQGVDLSVLRIGTESLAQRALDAVDNLPK
jgi:aminoglycoside phosphotransferase (APT) family kinase protein